MGDQTPFKHVPYFFSDVFDLSYEYWGDASGADELIHRKESRQKKLQRMEASATTCRRGIHDE